MDGVLWKTPWWPDISKINLDTKSNTMPAHIFVRNGATGGRSMHPGTSTLGICIRSTSTYSAFSRPA